MRAKSRAARPWDGLHFGLWGLRSLSARLVSSSAHRLPTFSLLAKYGEFVYGFPAENTLPAHFTLPDCVIGALASPASHPAKAGRLKLRLKFKKAKNRDASQVFGSAENKNKPRNTSLRRIGNCCSNDRCQRE